MAKLKIYGPVRSRAAWAHWTARELGLDFEQVEIAPDERGAFRKVNPNDRFPALVDGDLALFESRAINLYLAKTYGLGSLYPSGAAEEAQVIQWSFWAMAELEDAAMICIHERLLKPEAERSPAAAAAAEAAAEAAMATPLSVLNGVLAGRDYLVGDRFTVADLNVACVVEAARVGGMDIAAYPHVARWLAGCRGRPAAHPPG